MTMAKILRARVMTVTSNSPEAAKLREYFSFKDTATTEIYPLSLHDALPISPHGSAGRLADDGDVARRFRPHFAGQIDRKSTRLNSSHRTSSYAVFCLKK